MGPNFGFGFVTIGSLHRGDFMDTNDDKIWEIVQRLYALAGLLQRWNGEAFDNDVFPGLGHLLADFAGQLEGALSKPDN